MWSHAQVNGDIVRPLLHVVVLQEERAGPEAQSADSLEDIQRQHILRVLERTGWIISGPNGAGAILNVHPNTLRSLMDRLGIRRQAVPRTRRGPGFSQPVHDVSHG